MRSPGEETPPEFLMLTPDMKFTVAGRVDALVAAAPAVAFQGQGGFGFSIDERLAIDTDPPAGSTYVKGFRLNASGAVYGTLTTDPTDVWEEGIRRTTIGQIVFEIADPVTFSSRNPITAAGNFAVG